MGVIEDPFLTIVADNTADILSALSQKPIGNASLLLSQHGSPVVARFAGFDLQDQPLVADLACLPGEIVAARTIVSLRRKMIGNQLLIVFEDGDVQCPIILGVIQDPQHQAAAVSLGQGPMNAKVDDERVEIVAEREIVLRCGDASITLTRAGKVIIKGNYILSRSTGYNKIKGAAIDIN